MEKTLVCKKCGGHSIEFQAVNEVKEKRKKGLIYWLLIGFWWEPITWLLFTIPKLLLALFGKHKKITSETVTCAICQDCGYRWKIK